METLVKMEGVTKVFPGVRALDNISFEIKAGEVHVLMGENGAGKSTLMKILSGVYQPTSGKITVKGKEFTHLTPKDSYECGISIIYQELSVINELSILENLFVGKLPTRRVGGIRVVDYKGMTDRAREVLDKVGLKRRPGQLVEEISISEKQQCEIAKALISNADVIIMDEPTSSLTDNETAVLFRVIRSLKEKGIGIFYISHKLEEIIKISDRISVFRDGKKIITFPNDSTVSQDMIIGHMIGRKIENYYNKQVVEKGETALEVRGLTRKGVFEDVSFQVRKGEVLGFFGLVGAGRSEVMTALVGIDKADAGEIFIDGKPRRIHSPAAAISAGIGFVPEDRRQQGLILRLSVKFNSLIIKMNQIARFGVTNDREETRIANEYKEYLDIKTPNLGKSVGELSGGNQQKVVIAKWLMMNPKILILDEPTRGIDVGAKTEIYRLINELSAKGVAVIVISSELPEALGLSDRIITMAEGRITGDLEIGKCSSQIVMEAALGGKKHE